MITGTPMFSNGMTFPQAQNIMDHFNDAMAKNKMIAEGGPIGGFTPRTEVTNLDDPNNNQLELPLRFGQTKIPQQTWCPTLRSDEKIYHKYWIQCVQEDCPSVWKAYGDLAEKHDYWTCHICQPLLKDKPGLDEPTSMSLDLIEDHIGVEDEEFSKKLDKFLEEFGEYLNDPGTVGKIFTSNETNPCYTTLEFVEEDDLDGALFTDNEIDGLEGVEALYDKEKILTCRDKIESTLRQLMFMRKDHYDPELTENDHELYDRVNVAILFLLKLSLRFDYLQQLNHVEDTTPMKISFQK
jgi:hypothetical protein